MRGVSVLMIVVLSLCGSAYAERTVWYVHPDSALNTIQAGLDSCADNDVVLVAPGKYYENIVWPNTQGIHLISEAGPELTIVDGDSAFGRAIICSTMIDTTTMIGGFTIRNANGGGGIRCSNSASPQIVNNNICNSIALNNGGGIACVNASPVIMGNTITNNSAMHMGWVYGGGIYCQNSTSIIINNHITDNFVGYGNYGFGGGIFIDDSCSLIIADNDISNNTASAYTAGAGGIDCQGTSRAVIENCTVTNNYSTGPAGGIRCGNNASLTIHYCNITGNNRYGIAHGGYVAIDAGYNWWGDATGPYHPTLNPGGLGDTVSDYVDFDPWLLWPVGVEEQPIVKPVETHETLTATIFRGPLQLPAGKQCKVFDIAGRVVKPERIQPGIYFIEIDGVVAQKVVKVR